MTQLVPTPSSTIPLGLADFLSRHHIDRATTEIEALLRGLDAAALDRGDPVWLDLVLPGATPEQAAALSGLRGLYRPAEPASGDSAIKTARVAALRSELARRDLTGLIIPRGDEHLGEYVPCRAQRLAWITGFTGSAGLAILLATRGALFVDGRYTIQAATEADPALFEALPVAAASPPRTPAEWLATVVGPEDRIGIDGNLHTLAQLERFREALAPTGATLVELTDNPIDAVWEDQPPPPLGPVRIHPVAQAGRDADDKRAELAAALKRSGARATILSAPDSIAWLLNLRGSDVAHTPFALGFAIARDDGSVSLFLDPRKLLPGLETHLGPAVAIAPPDQFGTALDALAGQAVLIDPDQTACAILRRLEAATARILRAPDPCQLAKACKNPVELAGMRAAHHRDGVALTRFLAWLDRAAAAGELTEIAASDRLEAFRREVEGFRDLSFPSISAAGPHGALPHYRASPATQARLVPGSLYLIDSGGQYPDGTTDVTRTVAIGTPSAEHRDRFTRVLQGHIAIATARFPEGTSGTQLDCLARLPLWQAGLDYDHGTGHGVGSYLSVHEGPQRIAKAGSAVPLRPGMIVSNEPGYYQAGSYGIRIENLVAVQVETIPGAERTMLGFETLTLAPIDRSVIEMTLLSPAEIAWLDEYHARVWAEIGPLLDPESRDWLRRMTRPLSEGAGL